VDVGATRFHAQFLGERRGADVGEVCERLLAVQAQDLRCARLAIRARTSGLTVTDVDRQLNDGSLVIGWLNRGTLHLGPMNIPSIQGEAGAIVASWLPGTEGAGVADTLFGLQPFTGRLPESWAKLVNATTTPVNVGDQTYDPLYPYGWGLRTDSARARIVTVRDSLAKQNTLAAKLAAVQLTALLNPSHWNADGSVRDPVVAFVLLGLASPAVSGVTASAEANANLLVSVARDIAQAAVVANGAGAMSTTAAVTANAEHDLLVGNPKLAVAGLEKAWQTANRQ
jgi:beta-glucosidase